MKSCSIADAASPVVKQNYDDYDDDVLVQVSPPARALMLVRSCSTRVPWKMSKLSVYRVCATPLAMSEVVTLLQNPPEDGLSNLPPVTLKAGEIYLYRSEAAKENGMQ